MKTILILGGIYLLSRSANEARMRAAKAQQAASQAASQPASQPASAPIEASSRSGTHAEVAK